MDPHQIEKSRRATLRWRIIQSLHIASPQPLADDVLMQAVAGPEMPLTEHDLRVELDYLARRSLITISGRGEQPQWDCALTRTGTDLAEYEIPCEAGIARPQKYW